MRFEPAFLQDIRDRLTTSDIVGRHVRLKKAGSEWRGLSPFNQERSPSFFVNDRKQAWFDFSSGRNGNVFDFVMEIEGLSFPEAVAVLASDAGLQMPAGYGLRPRTASPAEIAERAARQAVLDAKRASRDAVEASRRDDRRAEARAIWDHSRPIEGTEAEAYLIGRGIDFPVRFPSLRFHPKVDHFDPETGKATCWPALIAGLQHPTTDKFAGIWRIYLDGSGGKAPVDSQKMGLGARKEDAASVRLGSPGPRANVGEGLESSLGVYGILRGRQGVQASLSTAGMVNFVAPTGCNSTLIWPDGDVDKIKVDPRTGLERHLGSAGLRAAEVLKERSLERRHPCSIQPIAKRARDFLDVYLKAKAVLDC